MADYNGLIADEAALERFWKLVDRRGPHECWPWIGATCPKGYGLFSYNRLRPRAHRVALAWATGADGGAGLFACHECDNPNCVNPGHLWWGNGFDNMLDKSRKGRWRNGTASGRKSECARGHILTPENIRVRPNGTRECRECRQLYKTIYNHKKRGLPHSYGPAETPRERSGPISRSVEIMTTTLKGSNRG